MNPGNSGFAEFQRRLRPQLDGLLAEVYRENRGSIRVKKEAVAVKNLERIFAAALKLSPERGFHAMTLRDLSRSAGLSMGSLYTYFGSKEELRAHIFNYGTRFAVDQVRSAAGQQHRPEDRLDAAMRTHLYLSEALRPWFYFSYMEAGSLPREERRSAMNNELATERIFAGILAEGRQAGCFEFEDVDLAAAAIKALLQDWYLKRWKYRERGVSVDQYAEFVIGFIRRAMAREPGRNPAPVRPRKEREE